MWVFPIISGTPKWMVYNYWKTLLKWDDLGGKPTILETPMLRSMIFSKPSTRRCVHKIHATRWRRLNIMES